MQQTTHLSAEDLSDVLLRIHRLSDQADLQGFQSAALAIVREWVAFDSAWWGLVSDMEVHSTFEWGLAPDYRQRWDMLKDQDPIAKAVLASPHKTVLFNQAQLNAYPVFASFLADYRIREVLCTVVELIAAGHHAFLSLYRQHGEFDEDSRRTMQCLMRHLVEAHHRTWRRQLEVQRQSTTAEVSSCCIINPRGLILSCDANFFGFLQSEWPRWKGPLLPDQILDAFRQAAVYRGRILRAEARVGKEFTLVEVSARNHLAELTERERQVAQAFANGDTYKTVARDLGLSPTTVRHYLRNVYSKLHIDNKAALVKKMSRVPV